MAGVRGHALWYDGGAVNNPETVQVKEGRRRFLRGRAKCECGFLSPLLDGNKARREWHHQHKLEVEGWYNQ